MRPVPGDGARYRGRIFNTLVLVVVAPLIALVFSVLVSWIVTRTRSPLRGAVDTLAFLPQVIPHILFAVALNYVAILIRRDVPLYGTVALIVLAHGIAYVAYGSRTLNSVMIQIHRELEEAGRLAGLTALATLRKIVVPLVSGAVFNAWFWIALLSYREVTMALTLYTQQNDVIATGIFRLWTDGRTNEVAALGTVLVLVALLVIGGVGMAFRRFALGRQSSVEGMLAR